MRFILRQLTSSDWYWLFREQPQFANECAWEEIGSARSWICLLIKQP